MRVSLFISGIMVITGAVVGVFIVSAQQQLQAQPTNEGREASGGEAPEDVLDGFTVALYRPDPSSGPVDSGNPVRLRIARIAVDAAVEYVGITTGGAMDAPKNQHDVAWFEPGVRPGDVGSAVMAGHYGWKDRKASAFDSLHKLRNGDTVVVETDGGELIPFVVRESRRYDAAQDATDVFTSTDGKSHLNLITCEGVWDQQAQQYTTRLVVFTDKAE